LEALTDPRVRVVGHATREGQSRARNTGIEAARGEWIAFLDDDDLWAPTKLRKQLTAAVEANAAWAFSGAIVLDERLSVLEVYEAPPPAELADMMLAYNAVPAGASNVVARADAIREVGGYDETLSQLADWDLWIRLALAGPPAVCEEPLMAYVQHPSGMLVTDKSGLIDEFERLEEKYREACEQRGIRLDRVGLVRWMAWGDSRGGRRVRAAGGYLHAMAMYARRGKLWSSGANLRDAIAALLGEKQTDSGRRPLPASEAAPPPWVDFYR
jgi:glycosyltransferase involved in cell wall biosynthesis